MRLRLLVFVLSVLSCAAAQGEPKALILHMDTPKPKTAQGKDASQQLLNRAFLRQALLIAERDEFGWVTRDLALWDAEKIDGLEADQALALHLPTERLYGQWVRFSVTQDGKSVADGEIPLQSMTARVLGDSVVWAEAWSRAGAVDLLKHLGGTPAPHKWVPEGEADPKGVALSRQWDVVSQIAAAQRLHRQIAEQGESIPRLSLLARVYANLGQLARPYYNQSFKAYRARGVLYDQRLAHRAPDDPVSDWTRAYAWAMLGHHGIALDHLAAGDKLADQRPRPVWVVRIHDFLHFRSQKLRESVKADADQQHLTAFLMLHSVEHNGLGAQTIEVGLEGLSTNSLAYRVIEPIEKAAGVGVNHRITGFAPMIVPALMAGRLPEAEGLPEAVDALIPEDPRRFAPSEQARVSAALVEAGRSADAGEPSWAVLGHALQEEQFVAAMARIDFVANSWSVDPAGEMVNLAPPLADHPYAPLLEYLVTDARRDPEKIAGLVKKLDIVEPHRWMWPVQQITRDNKDADPRTYERTWSAREQNADATYDEVAERIASFRKEYKINMARWLGDISPNAPLQPSILLRHDETIDEKQADRWAERFGEDVSVARGLGDFYARVGRTADSIAALERVIASYPEPVVYRRIASQYLAQGDEDRWLASLEAHLQSEDYGLSHARTRLTIAEHYVKTGQPHDALPYAEDAAQTWAAWAMIYAAGVNELVGDLDRAELWTRRVSERYTSSETDWFRWCARTDLGDIASARQLRRQWATRAQRKPTIDTMMTQSTMHYIDGDLANARRFCEAACEKLDKPHAYAQVMLAVITAKQGDAEARDRALLAATKGPDVGRSNEDRVALKEMAAYIHGCLTADPAKPLDDAELDRIIAKTTPGQQLNLHYFASAFVELAGDDERTIARLTRAADPTGEMLHINIQSEKKCFTLARYDLLQFGVRPQQFVVAPPGVEDGPE